MTALSHHVDNYVMIVVFFLFGDSREQGVLHLAVMLTG